MPTLALPDLHLPEAGPYLYAVMLRPRGSPEEHARYVDAVRNRALLGVAAGAELSKILPESVPEMARAALGPRLEDLAASYHKDLFVAGFNRGDMAGRLLMFVLCCAEHDPGNATLEYAYRKLGEAFGAAKLRGGSRAYLAGCWAVFAPVAHYWITMALQRPLWEAAARSGSKLAEFLGHAEDLRARGEAHIVRNSGPLLDPERTWRVPSKFILTAWSGSLPTPVMLIDEMKSWRYHVSKKV